MFLRRMLVEYCHGNCSRRSVVPLAWLDSYAMRNFTNDARFDDTLPASEGLLEVGLRVPIGELQASMEAWMRRKGWLEAGDSLLLTEQSGSQESCILPSAGAPTGRSRGETMQLTTLNRLLIDEIQELYIAEELIEDGLGRMVRGAAAEDLKKTFEHHASESKAHTQRLEKICEILEVSPRGGRGHSVRALLREAEDRMGDGGDPHVVDASLVGAARRIEHWEIASYSVAQVYANALHRTEVADLLGQTLGEEQATDDKLAAISHEVHVVEAPAHT